MRYFGRSYRSAAYLDSEPVVTPVWTECARCGEAIAAGDDGWMVPAVTCDGSREASYHRACFMRTITGSVAHQQFKCGCFVPGSSCHDDPKLTIRQAAEAALAYFEGRHS